MVCREAGTFWNEETLDKYPSMRPKIDAELAAVADEIETGGITWSFKDVKRLIIPYPTRKDVDVMLERLGEDYYHDAIEELDQDEEPKKKAAVAETSDQGELSASSSDSDAEVPAAVGGNKTAGVEANANVNAEQVCLSVEQAEAVHQVTCTISALQATVDNLRAIGSLRGAQCIEAEMKKEKRRVRWLTNESPDIAEAFLQRRKAEEERAHKQRRLLDDQKDREMQAAKAIADRKAAVAEFRKCKKSNSRSRKHPSIQARHQNVHLGCTWARQPQCRRRQSKSQTYGGTRSPCAHERWPLSWPEERLAMVQGGLGPSHGHRA